MFKSMTAYARIVLPTEVGTLVVEIQTVNRKHLEINSSFPEPFGHCEEAVRKAVSEVVHRGQVNIKVILIGEEKKTVTVQPNVLLAQEYKDAWQALAAALLPVGSLWHFTPDLLREVPGLFISVKDPAVASQCSECLLRGIHLALAELSQRKKQEGQALQQDIFQRIDLLKVKVREIEASAPAACRRYRDNLILRLNEQLPDRFKPESDEQLLKALCLFADKVDITEELVRFNAHLEHFLAIAATEAMSSGKSLDFLVQELNREANTIASKASDAEISQGVVVIKSELERIREQLQNIE